MVNRRDALSNSNPFADRPKINLNELTDSMLEGEPQVVEREVVVYQPDPNALIPQGDGYYLYKRFRMTPVGMEIPDDVTDQELMEIGAVLEGLENAVQWNLGDWYNRADRVWGQIYKVDDPEDEMKYQTLADYAWIARKVQFSIRNRKLSFSHHRNVAKLDQYPELQYWWLEYAIFHKLTVSVMKVEMSAISHLSPQEQIDKLQQHLIPEVRLSQKRPALSSGEEGVSKQIKGNAHKIAKYWDSLEQLSGKEREKAIEAGLEQRRLVNDYLRRLGVG